MRSAQESAAAQLAEERARLGQQLEDVGAQLIDAHRRAKEMEAQNETLKANTTQSTDAMAALRTRIAELVCQLAPLQDVPMRDCFLASTLRGGATEQTVGMD
jgi:hypothetical protein